MCVKTFIASQDEFKVCVTTAALCLCIIDLDMKGNNDKAVGMSGAIFLMTAGPLITRDRDAFFFDGCADDNRHMAFVCVSLWNTF